MRLITQARAKQKIPVGAGIFCCPRAPFFHPKAQYDYDKQKYDLSDDFAAKIDDFKVSQEPLKAFFVNHEQRFKARLAEPRDTAPTIGLKLPEPRFF